MDESKKGIVSVQKRTDNAFTVDIDIYKDKSDRYQVLSFAENGKYIRTNYYLNPPEGDKVFIQ